MDEQSNPIDISTDQAKVEAKKYIRTFEVDQQTVKQGGAPDLVPFVVSPPKIDPPPLPPAPVTPVPAQPVISQPVAPAPVMQAPAPSTSKPIEQKSVKLVDSLETYSSDFLERVKKTRASKATIIATEQDAKEGAPVIEEPKKLLPMAVVYSVAGVVLCVVGAVGAYIAVVHYDATHSPVALTPIVPSPIAFDEQALIEGEGKSFLSAIVSAAELPITSGTVKILHIATSTETGSTTPERLFASFGTTIPNVLSRNVKTGGSMMGVVNVGGRQSVFLILEVTSYKDTFSGMLSWEPQMSTDLGLLFPPYVETLATSTIASTTPRVKSQELPLKGLVFTDETIVNHDVRIARDAVGDSILVYGYWSPTTLVIARDPATFTDIVQRLANAHTQP